ncbi:MAG TPA: insulinase family protein, partial [Gemmatimonadales bacterium]|nr:insulinase family protein [Gemmatimonadales bacterium]
MYQRMLLAWAVLCAAVAAPVAPASAQQTAPPATADTQPPAARAARGEALPLDPAVRHGRLPNGLTYYVRRNEKPERRAELRLVVDAGSILETDAQRGLAHFVEHMAFNGTREYAKQELVSFIERIGMRFGAHLNASTGFDETIYQLRVPTDGDTLLTRGLDILGQWASAVTFDSAEVEAERGVVLEEWRLGLGAAQRILDKELPVMLAGSRYAVRLPIGDTAVIRHAPRSRMVRFYRDWYRPDLMAVVAVGDFDPDSVAGWIRRHLGGLPRRPPGTTAPRRTTFPIPPGKARGVVTTDPEASSSNVTLMHLSRAEPLRTAADWRRYAVERLADAMLTARFAELAQGADAPFLTADAGRVRFARPAAMAVLTATVENGAMVRGMRALAEEAERVRRYGFTDAELARAKEDLLAAYENAYAERDKTPSGTLVSDYIANFLRGDAAPGIAREYQVARRELPKITLAEVNRVGAVWLQPSGRVVLGEAPAKPDARAATAEELLDAVARAAGAKLTPYREALAAGPLVETPPEPGRVLQTRVDTALGTITWSLSNGATVVLKPTEFRADEVTFWGFAPGGTSLAPDSLLLAAQFSASAVSEMGYGAYSGTDLAKVTAGKDVSFAPIMSAEFTRLAGSARPRDAGTLLQLVWLAMTSPRRDSTVFDRFIARARSEAANRSQVPASALSDTLAATLAQHNPRVRPVTPARVDSVRLSDALGFWRARTDNAAGFTFIMVGNIDTTSFRSLVERWLGSLPSTGAKQSWQDRGIRPPDG